MYVQKKKEKKKSSRSGHLLLVYNHVEREKKYNKITNKIRSELESWLGEVSTGDIEGLIYPSMRDVLFFAHSSIFSSS